MVTICTVSLAFNNYTFCPHSVFVCFVWIWEQTAIISLYNINWLLFITETQCVYCAVRTGYLCIIQANFVLWSPVPCQYLSTNAPHLSLPTLYMLLLPDIKRVICFVFPKFSALAEIRELLPLPFCEMLSRQSPNTAFPSAMSVQMAVSFHLSHNPLWLSTLDFCEIISVGWRIRIVCCVIQCREVATDLVRIIAVICRHVATQLHQTAV